MNAKLYHKSTCVTYRFEVEHEGVKYWVNILTDENGKFTEKEVTNSAQFVLPSTEDVIVNYIEQNWNELTK
jgi:hypothetical protein